MASTISQSLPVSIHPPPNWRYDVFLSFHGKDTRYNFTSHLYSALIRRGIHVYKDDEKLEQGKTIESELWKAIEESMFSIVIFSDNYASSPWCLDELVIIIDSMKTRGQTILPIFYDVDPSDIANQKGSYEKAFLRYEEELKASKEKVKMWKDSLTNAANLCGCDVRNKDESKLILEIVERVWCDVSRTLLIDDKTLVGMDLHIEEMKHLLGKGRLVDVRFIGICGMGGIGKTTIAEVVYDKIHWQFEGSCFLVNVKEAFKDNHRVVSLQEQILSKIMGKQNMIHDAKSGVSEIYRCLKNKKILLILDDVDEEEHLKMFAGDKSWFGPGSRVIITSRDRHFLLTHGVDAIHEVDVLNDNDALKLFSIKAFTQKQPSEEYLEMSKCVLAHVKGLPLALSVLGLFLKGRSLIEWRNAIDKLDKIPHNKVMEVLRISFDALEELEKQIFLYIACCFRGENKDRTTCILDACGFYPNIGLQVLSEKCLINITKDEEIQMHDLLQAMGRYIAKDRGIWDVNDIRQVNTENKVEVVVLLGEHDWGLSSSDHEVLSRLNNLRILIVQTSRLPWEGVSTHLSNELRYFEWENYPFRTLPSSFQPNKLVELRVSYSGINQLWYGRKVLNCLKTLHLKSCDNLVETPDFTGAPNLEILKVSFCRKLSKLHPSSLKLKRLIKLVLRDCGNLQELPSNIEMESLHILDLGGCSKLITLPDSIQNLVGLVSLKLQRCENLQSLPSSVVHLKTLKELEIFGCSNLDELPEDICQLRSLKRLDLRYTGIRQLPLSTFLLKNLEELYFEGIWVNIDIDLVKEPEVLEIPSLSGMVSLKRLELVRCSLGEGSIPDDIGCLSKLTYLNLTGNNFISLPRSISQLNELVEFILEDCRMLKKLPEIPPNLGILSLNGCIALEELPDSIKLQGPTISAFQCFYCLKLYQNIGGHRITSKMIQQYIKDLSNPANPGSGLDIIVPGKKIPRWFSNQREGGSVTVTTPIDMLCGSNGGLMGFAACVLFKASIADNQNIRCRIDSIIDEKEFVQLEDWPRHYSKSTYSIAGSDHCWSFYVSFHQFEKLKDQSISHLRLTFRTYSRQAELIRCGVRLVSFQDIHELKIDSLFYSWEEYAIDEVQANDTEQSFISSWEEYAIDEVQANDTEQSFVLCEVGSVLTEVGYYRHHPFFSEELRTNNDIIQEVQADDTKESSSLCHYCDYYHRYGYYHHYESIFQESNTDDNIGSCKGYHDYTKASVELKSKASLELKSHVALITIIVVLLALLKECIQ